MTSQEKTMAAGPSADPLEVGEPTRPGVADTTVDDGGVIDELLVEEISIDGMCGVY